MNYYLNISEKKIYQTSNLSSESRNIDFTSKEFLCLNANNLVDAKKQAIRFYKSVGLKIKINDLKCDGLNPVNKKINPILKGFLIVFIGVPCSFILLSALITILMIPFYDFDESNKPTSTIEIESEEMTEIENEKYADIYEQLIESISKVNISVDEQTGDMLFLSSDSDLLMNESRLVPFINLGQDSKGEKFISLGMWVGYSDKTLLNMDSAMISTDEYVYVFDVINSSDINSVKNGDEYIEDFNVACSLNNTNVSELSGNGQITIDLLDLKEIALSSNTKIKFSGVNGSLEYSITELEKNTILNMMILYEYIQNEDFEEYVLTRFLEDNKK